jgi:cell division protease FtsH
VHEAGHALVAKVLPNADPLHKVTIIPRGRALGLTQQLPEEDRLNINQEFALNQIAILMGGRVAEEIVFGQKTTGAGNDIEQATNMAHSMVCEWGMSERMGPLAFGKKEGEVFLGRDMAHTQTYSEQTALEIDAEVRRIVTEQYERAKRILTENREALDKIADALLEHETLDLADVDALLAGGSITRPPPPKSPPPADRPDQQKTKKPGLLDALGGMAKPEPGKA